MPRYEYTGEGERVIPSLKLIVKKGDTFDAPDGFKASGVVQVSSGKTAPAVQTEKKELPKEEVKPSAPSDMNAGA